MLIIHRKKFFLRIAEVYFAESIDAADIKSTDIAFYIQSKECGKGCRVFNTLFIDLKKDEGTLLSEMKHHTRVHTIKKANKEWFVHSVKHQPDEKDILGFAAFYDRFAENKGIKKCNTEKLKALNRQNAIVLTGISSLEGEVYCMHLYVTDGKRARILYGASLYRLPEYEGIRNALGHVHRYHNWQDILYFKEKGFEIYDFGGLTLDKNNKGMNNIDNYKMGFGGSIATGYNCVKPCSILGQMALLYIRGKDGNR